MKGSITVPQYRTTVQRDEPHVIHTRCGDEAFRPFLLSPYKSRFAGLSSPNGASMGETKHLASHVRD